MAHHFVLHCMFIDVFTLGDAAIGDGVKRYFLSQVISRVQFGFALDFGE